MKNIVEIKNINQSFRTGFWLKRAHVLHDVSLDIPEGSIFGFLGPNGAGKTSLIHLMVGIRIPVSGQILINGGDLSLKSTRAQVGYLPERPYFHDHLTGNGLLKYLGALSGLESGLLKRRIPEVLELVGLQNAAQKELRRYSKGMLQRIGIAQAILHKPAFLVLDEPMSGLDPVGRKEIRELIEHLAEQGQTVFFSSHVIPDVEALCDQVALIQNGRLIHSGAISKLIDLEKAAVEIVCGAPKNQAAFDALGFDEVKQIAVGYKCRIQQPQSHNEWIQKIINTGASIESVNPVQTSLETFFQKEINIQSENLK